MSIANCRLTRYYSDRGIAGCPRCLSSRGPRRRGRRTWRCWFSAGPRRRGRRTAWRCWSGGGPRWRGRRTAWRCWFSAGPRRRGRPGGDPKPASTFRKATRALWAIWRIICLHAHRRFSLTRALPLFKICLKGVNDCVKSDPQDAVCFFVVCGIKGIAYAFQHVVPLVQNGFLFHPHLGFLVVGEFVKFDEVSQQIEGAPQMRWFTNRHIALDCRMIQ